MGTCSQFTRRHSGCLPGSSLQSAPCRHLSLSAWACGAHLHPENKPWPGTGSPPRVAEPARPRRRPGLQVLCFLCPRVAALALQLLLVWEPGGQLLSVLLLVSHSHCVRGVGNSVRVGCPVGRAHRSLSPVHAVLGPGGGRGWLTLVPKTSLCHMGTDGQALSHNLMTKH